jgi:hypothetical protein
MRKKRNLIVLLALITGLVTWLYIRQIKNNHSKGGKIEFAIDKPETITKVFISNRTQGHVLLEKRDGVWMVNGKYEASKAFMAFFLNETLKKIRVAGPVPLPAREGVIASMATMATKIEIYIDNELSKVYYVGNPTSEMTGTYMHLEGSKEPYITHIPGFNGFLSTRYPVDEKEWVSKDIFNYQADEIKTIDVNFPSNEMESFTIARKGRSNDFDVISSEKAPTGMLNYAAVKSFFGLFSNKSCEGIIDLSKNQIDSIKATGPICILTVTTHQDKLKRLSIYRRASNDRDHGLFDNKGNRLAYDPSRYNAFLDNDNRVFVIQDIVFDPIMIKYSNLFIKQVVD